MELVAQHLPKSQMSEAFRALRTSLLLSRADHPPQVILVTSALPREGKTTAAANLAVTLAQLGDKTVVVDADLRKPGVGRLLNMTGGNYAGLSSYLAGVSSLDLVTVPHPSIPNLAAIPTGPLPPNPADLFSSHKLAEAIKELRGKFKFIVIDSPPVMAATDAVILSVQTDGVLLVVRSGETPKEAFTRTRDLLVSVKCNILGVVLNAVDASAIGVFAFVASAGGAVGLLAGGILTQAINWHWIFFVNLPIGVVTAVLALRVVPRDQGTGLRHGADVPGAVLITTAMMLSVYTIVKPASENGWLAGRTLAFGAVSVALLAGFLVRQMTARNPLMPLRILASRKIAAANVIQVLTVAGMFGMFFLGALYLRLVQGYSPLRIGLAFLPVGGDMGTLSIRFTDRLAARFGARTILVAGLVLVVAALTLLAEIPVHASYAGHVFPVMLLMGAGSGLAFPVLMTVAMDGVTPDDAGLASGLLNTTAQVGGALGLAVLATVSAGRTSALAAHGASTAIAATGGYHLAFWIADALAAAAIVVTLATVCGPAIKRRGSGQPAGRPVPRCSTGS